MEEKEEREVYGSIPGLSEAAKGPEASREEASVGLPVEAAEDVTEDAEEDLPLSEKREQAEPVEENGDTSLDEALAFALLFAPFAGSGADEGALFKRYRTLRSLGLSVQEAFSAASCSYTAPEAGRAPASKAHLVSGVPKGCDRGLHLAGEELRLARELLGDDYSGEELASLYRRVTK